MTRVTEVRSRNPSVATPPAWPGLLAVEATRAAHAAAGELHLWLIALRHLAAASGQERRKHVRDARRDAWSGVRRVLASYTGSDPAALAFERDAAGKPRLIGYPGIDFSLTHAEGVAVVAVSCDTGIGVDVEAIRTFEDAEGLARRFLTPSEHETVARTDPDDRDRVFLQSWTRKEAVLKAAGVGLAWDTRGVQTGAGPETTRVDAGLPGGITACVRSGFLPPCWLLSVAWTSSGEEPALRAFDASMLSAS